MPTLRFPLLAFFASALVACGSSASNDPPSDAGPDVDPEEFAIPPRSCALDCPVVDCPEEKDPYACPSANGWKDVPHAATCAAWDGTFPAVQPGKCTASAPTGEAAKYAGRDPDKATTIILPDGRRVAPAGAEWIFDEKDLPSGLPTTVIAIPGTKLAVTVDSGYGPHAVRAIDTSKIGTGNPVVSYLKFAAPSTLNGAIVFVPPNRLFVASDDGSVHALSIDTTTGKLDRVVDKSISLPPSKDGASKVANFYVSGLAVSPDGKRMVATAVFDRRLLVFDVGEGSSTYGKQLGEVDIGATESYGAWFDPKDTTGSFAYVSLRASRSVVEVDLGTPASPKVARSFSTDKNPQGIAFLDARWMAVANDFGDTLTLVDRVAGSVTAVPVDSASKLHGFEPTTLAYDATAKRLYASLAAMNAVSAFDVDLSSTPPKLTPAGRLGTSWWPSGVAVMDDGSLVVSSMRGHGTGPDDKTYPGFSDGDIMSLVRGGVQHVPAPSSADLIAGEAAVKANDDVGALAGAPKVTCPAGANDFPIPSTNTEGPSKQITKIIFVVRENKKFDGLLGDFKGAEGKPELLIKKTAADMDRIWGNFRALASAFAISDDYYTSAELSVQGHVWTTYGRTSDFNERTWAMDGDGRNTRNTPFPASGILDVGQPEEGSLFDWLGKNGVVYDVLGEGVGSPRVEKGKKSPIDTNYPGGFIQSLGYPDVEKACYVAGRLRVRCDLGSFVYMTLPNDHTQGVGPKTSTPETYVAVNDDATGLLVDAVSHSPYWASTLVVVTEDDPSWSGDHIDAHRTPLLLISPWVKRGYVSKTHIDISSLHKLFAHILGLPYPNVQVATAGLPLDAFTSTPDYSAYVRKARVVPLACGSGASAAEKALTDSWDFDDVDEQPGLDAQAVRWMRGEQLQTLTPKLQAEIAARLAKRIE